MRMDANLAEIGSEEEEEELLSEFSAASDTHTHTHTHTGRISSLHVSRGLKGGFNDTCDALLGQKFLI